MRLSVIREGLGKVSHLAGDLAKIAVGAGVVSLFAAVHPQAASAQARNAEIALESYPGKCLGPSAGKDANGNNYVVIWDCVGNPNQIWTWSGYGQIINRSLSRCITSNGANAALTLNSCEGWPKQKWALTRETGKFNNEEGWCADAPGGRTDNGTTLIAYSCGSQWNQKWRETWTLDELTVPGFSALSAAQKAAFARIRSPGTTVEIKPVPPGLQARLGRSVLVVGNRLIGLDGGTYTVSGDRLIGLDGATMVAAGAGNMVAAGAGNMVAAGAGNIMVKR